eukprot:gene45143-61158_t
MIASNFAADKFEAIIKINLTSAWYLIQAAVPLMKAAKWGRIISTASAHSLVASPNKSAYVMAKHGIAGLTKTIALETATDGITVNCISPGYVWTPLVESQIPDTMKTRGLPREISMAAENERDQHRRGLEAVLQQEITEQAEDAGDQHIERLVVHRIDAEDGKNGVAGKRLDHGGGRVRE